MRFCDGVGQSRATGTLTVAVDTQGRGIGRAMLDEMTRYMDSREFALQGLFTHPQSPTHIRLYEAYGFRMKRITLVKDRVVRPATDLPVTVRCFSELPASGKPSVLRECRRMAESVYGGLDLGGKPCRSTGPVLVTRFCSGRKVQ